MELTDTGRLFLTRAYAILASVEDARNLPQQIAPVSGELTLAATYTVMGYFLPDHLQRLSLLYPAIRIRMLELDRETIESGLLAQHYDMAMLLTSNVRNPAIQTETLFSSRRRLWVSTQHRFAKNSEVSFAEIAKEPFIMLTVDEAADSALRYWHQHGFEPSVSLNTKSIEAVRSLVANDLGVAILSDMVYRPWSLEGKRIETIKTVESVPSMNVGLAWRAETVLSPAMQTIRQYFKQRYLEPQSPHSSAHR
jgi:DNA-binding transcriptional LysR family regulator